MSFLGGGECSTGANPLAQFTKHVQDDKSLQRDRLAGRGPGAAQESMRSQGGQQGGQDTMMDNFLQQSTPIPQPSLSPFAMEHMQREIEQFQASRIRPREDSNIWASQFDPQAGIPQGQSILSPGSQISKFNPADFAAFQKFSRATPATLQAPEASTLGIAGQYQNRLRMGYGLSGGRAWQATSPFANNQSQRPLNTSLGKGKERLVELNDENWEAHFAQIDEQGHRDMDAEANEAIEKELNETDRSVLSETNDIGDFESIWRGIQAETEALRERSAEAVFRDENITMGDPDQWEGFDWIIAPGGFSQDPEMGNYLFEEENLFKDVQDPFGEGMRIMKEGGNLSLAALAFEAAAQKDPQHVEAWSMLGQAQAQNEKESPAIRALEKALRLDPSNLPALMGLAVSYTNEGYDSSAFRTLERWLSIKYPAVVPASDLSAGADLGFTDRLALHEKVTSQFISAAQLSPDGEHMDPDVQVGLGVLFYGAEEYNKAVDCFSAALASSESGSTTARQQIHLLWNRLGATLANSGRSEEAIAAYEKALTLNPNFVRARYNLGVSCMNIGCSDQAAQHLLGALDMHRYVEREGRQRAREVLAGVAGGVSDGDLERIVAQNQSTNLYDTLRRVFGQMGRADLSDAVGPGMDVDALRAEFDP
ncbi:MAG: hypothetical protein M1825_006163 [Sarcosagium campestre]|nr:MAG: hypothetical protein M1825_006163 [Sarcosagium campestre]